MHIFNKILFTSILSSSILLIGCSDKKSNTEQNQQTKESSSTSSTGNWQAKASELSSANAMDIKSDLAQLNQITNQSNSQALQLREQAQAAASDPQKLKEVLSHSNDIQKEFQQKLMGLQLKSSEIQNIRTQMIDNLLTSQKLYELSTVPNFDMKAPSKEFKQLSMRTIAIQQKVGAELDGLNKQYP